MASMRSINSTPRDNPDFIQKDLHQYRCPVSGDILRDCVQLPCGHKVCADCVDQLFTDSSTGHCPISEEDCFPFLRDEVLPDYGTRREILKLKVYCNYKRYGCSEEMEWLKLENHCSSCQYRLVSCVKEGCDEKMPFNDLDDHIINSCQYSEVTCQYCNEPVLRKNIQEHLSKTCPSIEVPCKYNCDVASMPRRDMIEHESHCTKKPSKCPYSSAGCPFEGTEQQVSKHAEESIVEHLSLSQNYTKNMEKQNVEIQRELMNIKSEKDVWQSQIIEIKSNYDSLINQVDNMRREYQEFQVRIISTVEKVFSMEEMMRQLPTKQVTDQMSRDLRSLRDSQEELNRKINELERGGITSNRGSSTGSRTGPNDIEALKKQVQNLERQTAIQDIRLAELDLRFQILETASYDGVLIWKIMDYSRRKQDAVSGRTFSLFSQPFYTGRFGYKMCGRVYLNGDGMGKGTHLSLFFVVMKGEHDALMPWPFKQTINMALLDQQDGVSQVTDSFRPDTTSSSFQRPTTDMNTAVGCPLFVSHQKLETQKYLKDDALFIKIIVDKTGLPHH